MVNKYFWKTIRGLVIDLSIITKRNGVGIIAQIVMKCFLNFF